MGTRLCEVGDTRGGALINDTKMSRGTETGGGRFGRVSVPGVWAYTPDIWVLWV